jgi:choline dehydrogenase-like flavoprotein
VIALVETLRELGNSPEVRPFVKREVMPGDLTGIELENFLRDGVTTYWHAAGTATMGRDPMSVVDGNLKVYGHDNLRVVDASIMPRIASANTMAPCGHRRARRTVHHRGYAGPL